MAGKTIEANVTQAVPFFAVSNMERSLRFYVDSWPGNWQDQSTRAPSNGLEFESRTDAPEETVLGEP